MAELEQLQERNWLELPSDVTANILMRVGMIDILENAQKVCTLWRKICKDPAMWRVVNMNDLLKASASLYFMFDELFKHVIDRSQGQLVEILFVYGDNDALLQYVADRSGVLRSLKITGRHEDQDIKGLTDSLVKFPLLEELISYKVKISKETIETAGRHCTKLITLGVLQRACKLCVVDANEESVTIYNEIAIAIGGNFRELRRLLLLGNKMSNIGLQAILDGCRYLETLDLRECFYIDLKGNTITRCLKQINHLKLPTDSLESDPYVCAIHDDVSDPYVCARHDDTYEPYDDFSSADCYDPLVYDGYVSQ